jgi:multicomponent Na+:H+ antiporter subunit G
MIGLILMFVGSIFSIIGSIGLIRFPDVYTRSHAQTVVNVGGVVFILVGVMIDNFYSLIFTKALFLIIFIYFTSPVGTHAITKAAYLSGVKPMSKKDEWKKYRS